MEFASSFVPDTDSEDEEIQPPSQEQSIAETEEEEIKVNCASKSKQDAKLKKKCSAWRGYIFRKQEVIDVF